MARFEKTPELFGCGSGGGTGYSVTCEFCGTTHNENAVEDEPSTEGETVSYTNFAGKCVCECCFEAIELAVFNRIYYIIPWFIRILERRDVKLREGRQAVDELKSVLDRNA
jgi:hypothetical protein